ncbi:MAG: hypothetical protein H6738_08515 [Alphaproteobacteria bacterium]|nr:hypothetical protein [Alphaproteobacteria bacterium]MCB9696803.1 hypothetical protein [Alphaproteobacteria bacterium]
MISTLFLVLGGPTLIPAAHAADSSQGTADARATLRRIATTESEVLQQMLDAIDAAGEFGLSEQAKTAYARAKAKHGEARGLWEAKKYKAAYEKFYDVWADLQPTLAETLAMEHPPQPIVDAAERQVKDTAPLISQLAGLVQDLGDAQAKAAYTAAKTKYEDAKRMWENQPNKRREAVVKVHEAMKDLDTAIRSVWAATREN